MPGEDTNSKGNTVLMNDICDMSQIVDVILVTNESSTTLAENFSDMCL